MIFVVNQKMFFNKFINNFICYFKYINVIIGSSCLFFYNKLIYIYMYVTSRCYAVTWEQKKEVKFVKFSSIIDYSIILENPLQFFYNIYKYCIIIKRQMPSFLWYNYIAPLANYKYGAYFLSYYKALQLPSIYYCDVLLDTFISSFFNQNILVIEIFLIIFFFLLYWFTLYFLSLKLFRVFRKEILAITFIFSFFYIIYLMNVLDPGSVSFICIGAFIGIMAAIEYYFDEYTYYHNDIRKYNDEELFIIIILFGISVTSVFKAQDIVTLYIGLELFTFTTYILLAHGKYTRGYALPTMSYYIIGSVSSVLILYGLSILYGYSGSIDFSEIIFTINRTPLYIEYTLAFGLFISLIGCFLKLGLAPFSFWVYPIYAGHEFQSLIILNLAPKLIYSFFLFKFIIFTYCLTNIYALSLIFTSIYFTLVYGTIKACYQTEIRKFLAYSSIANLGYIVIPFLHTCVEGIVGFFFYIFVYISHTFLLFVFFIAFSDGAMGRSMTAVNSTSFVYLRQFVNARPMIYFVSLVVFCSLAGLPPFLGFISKFYLFAILVKYGFFSTMIFILIMSCISSFYYLKLTYLIFFYNQLHPLFSFEAQQQVGLKIKAITLLYNTPFIIAMLLCLFSIVIPWLFLDRIYLDVLKYLTQILQFLKNIIIILLKIINHVGEIQIMLHRTY